MLFNNLKSSSNCFSILLLEPLKSWLLQVFGGHFPNIFNKLLGIHTYYTSRWNYGVIYLSGNNVMSYSQYAANCVSLVFITLRIKILFQAQKPKERNLKILSVSHYLRHNIPNSNKGYFILFRTWHSKGDSCSARRMCRQLTVVVRCIARTDLPDFQSPDIWWYEASWVPGTDRMVFKHQLLALYKSLKCSGFFLIYYLLDT